MTGKFDLQKIINEVKSIITPAPIPEANKDDPIGYHLSELNKLTKELAENHTKAADLIAKASAILGELYQAITKAKAIKATSEQEAIATSKVGAGSEPNSLKT